MEHKMKILKLTTLLALTLMAHNAFSAPVLINLTDVSRYSLTGSVADDVNLNLSFSFDPNYPDYLRIFDIDAGLTTSVSTIGLFGCVPDCDLTTDDWVELVSNIDNTDFTIRLRFTYDPLYDENDIPISSEGVLTFEEYEYSVVPEPATIALLVSGLVVFGVAGRKNIKA
jgi:hypothetical protein